MCKPIEKPFSLWTVSTHLLQLAVTVWWIVISFHPRPDRQQNYSSCRHFRHSWQSFIYKCWYFSHVRLTLLDSVPLVSGFIYISSFSTFFTYLLNPSVYRWWHSVALWLHYQCRLAKGSGWNFFLSSFVCFLLLFCCWEAGVRRWSALKL